MTTTLHTDRLALAPWEDRHAELLVDLAATPAVVRHIGDGSPWTAERARLVAAANVEHWRRHGFGWRIAHREPDADPIGFIALSFAGEGAGVDPLAHEIGWWLAPAHWGQGLAREGAAAVRDEAFTRIGAPSILARIQPDNAASLAVAAAIGLIPAERTTGRFGEPVAVLRLAAPHGDS